MNGKISVHDLRGLFLYLTEARAQYALAGGLAVGLWAEHLLDGPMKDRLGLPVYSEDVDFRGHRFLADGIKAWMDAHGIQMGQISVAVRKGAEGMGKIFNMPFRPLDGSSDIQAAATVEILERLPLLDSGIEEPPNGCTVLLAGVHVLDPFSLLVCKLHAYHTRPVSERGQDLDHLRILAALLPSAVELCRSKGIGLAAEASRLAAILDSKKFPMPLGPADSSAIEDAIARSVR